MPQATPRVVDTPKSESTDSDEVKRMPRSVKRRTEEPSPSYTPGAGYSDQAQVMPANNTKEITPNATGNNVDTTNKKSGEDRKMTALQRFSADIGIGGTSTNITRDELMDLVQAKFDKIDAEQPRKAAREAMEIEKQVPTRNDNAGSSASGGDNAAKSVTCKEVRRVRLWCQCRGLNQLFRGFPLVSSLRRPGEFLSLAHPRHRGIRKNMTLHVHLLCRRQECGASATF